MSSTVAADAQEPDAKKTNGPTEFDNISSDSDKDEDEHHHHHDGKQEQELTEETFANYVEEAKKELGRFKGVGPKTVACVLMFCLERESEFLVDTHVHHIAKR